MENNITTESGLQLIARLCKRPSLLHLDDILFPEGPEPGAVVQVSGQSTVGKSLLLLKLLAKCLLPKSHDGVEIGGLEAGAILINTDHNISILKLISLMEQFVYSALSFENNKDKKKKLINVNTVEKIIMNSVKNLIILDTHSSLQLELNFYSLEKILSGNITFSLIVIDSLTSYFWSDITKLKSIKKMDLYLKLMIEKLKKCIEEFKMVTIFATQGNLLKEITKKKSDFLFYKTQEKLCSEYFQCRQKEYSSGLIKHKIELKKNKDMDNSLAYINSQKSVYQYNLSDKGFTWVV